MCSLHSRMAGGGDDVAAKVASVSNYLTYKNLELLYKWRLEEEGAIVGRKALQILCVHKNTNWKRTRSRESLYTWLTRPCNLRFEIN